MMSANECDEIVAFLGLYFASGNPGNNCGMDMRHDTARSWIWESHCTICYEAHHTGEEQQRREDSGIAWNYHICADYRW